MIRIIFLFLFITGSVSAQTSNPPKSPSLLLEESKKINWDEAVSESVTIEAPVAETWAYASNSLEAINWSVYFDHISPLPGPVADGQVGSLRRCFRNKDESGYAWDEVIINVEPLKLRQIVTYNFINYPFSVIHDGQYVFVRQIYEDLGEGRSRLTFQTTTHKGNNPFFKFIFWISRKETGDIFQKNLMNIKAAIEKTPRVFPWVAG